MFSRIYVEPRLEGRLCDFLIAVRTREQLQDLFSVSQRLARVGL